MEKEVVKTVKVTICDVCGKLCGCGFKCLICGKDVCFECKDSNMQTFNFAVGFTGSDDGEYCNECLSKPIPSEHIDLLNAYRAIANLRNEYKAWDRDFTARSKAAEERLQALLK